MTKNEKNTFDTSSIADVIAEAEAANLLHEEKTIPAQATSDKTKDGETGISDEDENTKKSFGARFKTLGEKLKANRKGVIITLAVVGAAAVAVAKFAAKTVVEEVVDSSEAAFEEAYSDKGDEKQDDSTPDA